MITTRQLLKVLDTRDGDDAARKMFDQKIWDEHGSHGAILVTDLSGMTRLTQKHGILHFLRIFRRCEVLCLPVISQFGGSAMKQEADDLIVIFPDAISAIQAGVGMQRVTQEVNGSLPEDDRVHMCIGLESGRLLRLADDAFGDVVNVAFKLGEDIAEPGEVLIGETAHTEAAAAGFNFGDFRVSDPRAVEAGKVMLSHRALRLQSDTRS